MYFGMDIVLSITPVLSIRVETGTLQNFPSNFKLFSRTKTKASTTRSARAVLQTTAAREPRRFLHNYFWEERGDSKTTFHGPRGHIRTNLIEGNMVRGLSFYSEKSFSENSENLVFFSQIIESLLIIPDMFFMEYMYGNVQLSSLLQYLKK